MRSSSSPVIARSATSFPQNLANDTSDANLGDAAPLPDVERRYHGAQMELTHANRVATTGRLTASIALEVKHPITATVINAEAALTWLDRQPPNLEEVRRALARIVKDGSHAAEVIDRIRDLNKKVQPRKEPLKINEAILEVIELTHGETAKHGILVRAELADGLPFIQGDRVQLRQVIINLIINAVDAMSGLNEGSRELLIGSWKSDCGDVLVGVRDSGPGLAPATLERLFEAFHTTKPGGLGLGLSICRSIIEAHGGQLWAEANVPQGANFQFRIPVTARAG
jgi:C4-dicarboxylate-specific signal transduction histidine kinase